MREVPPSIDRPTAARAGVSSELRTRQPAAHSRSGVALQLRIFRPVHSAPLAPLDPVEKPGRHFRSEQFCTDVTRSARLSFHLGPERRCPNCNDISRGRQLFGPENRADCL
jgi:hypothetical protein